MEIPYNTYLLYVPGRSSAGDKRERERKRKERGRCACEFEGKREIYGGERGKKKNRQLHNEGREKGNRRGEYLSAYVHLLSIYLRILRYIIY